MSSSRGPDVSWRATVDRVVLGCAAFMLAVQLTVCLAALGQAEGAGADTDLVRVGLVAGCDLALLLVCAAAALAPQGRWVRSCTWPATAVSIVGLVAAAGLAAPSPLPTAALQIVPVNSVQAVQLLVIAIGLGWRRATAVVLLTGPVYVGLRSAVAGSSVLPALDEWVLPTATSLGVLAVLHHLRTGADCADDLAASAQAVTVQGAALANAELARDDARRVLHDDVVSALRAVELGLGPEDVRMTAASALASLDGTSSLMSLEEFERELRRTSPIEVQIEVVDWQDSPPPRVLLALRSAAAEALRNAARHGQADHARVELSSTGARTQVVVTDRGSGLPDDWTPGFGVQESIIGRLTEIGGDARLERASEGGTVVRLSWPDQTFEADRTALPVVPHRRHALRLVGAACAVTTIYSYVRLPGERAGLGLVVALAVLAALVVVINRTGAAEPADLDGGPPLLVVGVLLGILTWLGLVAAGDGALLSMRSWIVGSVANVLVLIAFDVTARRILPVLGTVLVAIVGFAAYDPTITVTEPLGALATPIVVVGMGSLLGAGLRHGERLMAGHRAALVARAETDAWERDAVASRRRHLAHLEDDVVPFLREAASRGVADQGTARLLAARCRDELYLDRPMDPHTRDVVQQARSRGVTVTLRAGRHEGTSAWPLLRSVLGLAGPSHTVTVVPAGESGAGRVVVSPPLGRVVDGPRGLHDRLRSTYLVSTEGTTRVSDQATVGMDP